VVKRTKQYEDCSDGGSALRGQTKKDPPARRHFPLHIEETADGKEHTAIDGCSTTAAMLRALTGDRCSDTVGEVPAPHGRTVSPSSPQLGTKAAVAPQPPVFRAQCRAAILGRRRDTPRRRAAAASAPASGAVGRCTDSRSCAAIQPPPWLYRQALCSATRIVVRCAQQLMAELTGRSSASRDVTRSDLHLRRRPLQNGEGTSSVEDMRPIGPHQHWPPSAGKGRAL
jgi:hypothetical protein